MKMANEGKKEKKHQEKLECPGISSMYEWIGEYLLYLSRVYRWLSVFLKWAGKKKGFAVDYNSRTAPTFIGGR